MLEYVLESALSAEPEVMPPPVSCSRESLLESLLSPPLSLSLLLPSLLLLSLLLLSESEAAPNSSSALALSKPCLSLCHMPSPLLVRKPNWRCA